MLTKLNSDSLRQRCGCMVCRLYASAGSEAAPHREEGAWEQAACGTNRDWYSARGGIMEGRLKFMKSYAKQFQFSISVIRSIMSWPEISSCYPMLLRALWAGFDCNARQDTGRRKARSCAQSSRDWGHCVLPPHPCVKEACSSMPQSSPSPRSSPIPPSLPATPSSLPHSSSSSHMVDSSSSWPKKAPARVMRMLRCGRRGSHEPPAAAEVAPPSAARCAAHRRRSWR